MRKKGFFKSIATFAICGIIGLISVVPVSATQNNNTDISQQCGFTLQSTGQFLKKICDSNTYTSTTFQTGDTIVVYNDSQFINGIYIVSDSPMGTYNVASGGTEQTCGENAFIHDYTKIQTPSNTVEITILEDNVTIDEVYVLAEGEVPDWVQIWSPPVERADILLFPTHSYDEYVMFGGIIPYYAGERGLSVQIVYMTNSEDDVYKKHESLDALWAGGIKNYPVTSDFPDKYTETLIDAGTIYNSEEWETFQVNMIRRFKPQVIIGHDVNGEYGHGAHILNTETLKLALEDAKDSAKFPESAEEYGVWDAPKTYLHLYSEKQVNMNWDTSLSKFANKTAYDVAVEAFSKYKSQQQNYYVHNEQDGTAYDNHLFGLYRTNVGDDKGMNDFMENLIAYAEQPEPSETIPAETTVANGDDGAAAVNGQVSTVTTLVSGSSISAGGKIGFWICMFIGLIAVIIMWIVCIQMAKEKKEKQKRMEQLAMRKKKQAQNPNPKNREVSHNTSEQPIPQKRKRPDNIVEKRNIQIEEEIIKQEPNELSTEKTKTEE